MLYSSQYSSQYSFPVTDKLSLFMITTWRNVITNLKKRITTLKVYGEYRQWNIIDNAMPEGKELWLVIIPQIIMARKRHFVLRGFPPHNLCNEYVKIKYMRITRRFAFWANITRMCACNIIHIMNIREIALHERGCGVVSTRNNFHRLKMHNWIIEITLFQSYYWNFSNVELKNCYDISGSKYSKLYERKKRVKPSIWVQSL